MDNSRRWLAALDAPGAGFDVVVVVVPGDARAVWWAQRLERTRGSVIREDALLVVVPEGRPLGNGLGTLKAIDVALRREPGLWRRLDAGAAVAVFHTGGAGTRLEPLTSAEGDKSAVRVPGAVSTAEGEAAMTLLEAVIRTTAPLAEIGAGRITVLWGDQIVVPGRALAAPVAPVALLGRSGPVPDAASWTREGWSSKGALVFGAGRVAQVEKLDAERFFAWAEVFGATGVAASLGSFSMSAALARALLDEHKNDLQTADARCDTDPDWWMPLSLDGATYAAMRPGREGQHQRMSGFARAFGPGGVALGVIDVGADAQWWDLGTLAGWTDVTMRVREDGDEARLLRRLLRTADPVDGSVRVGSKAEGRAVRSVLLDVECPDVDVEDSVIVGFRGPTLHARRIVVCGPVRIDVGMTPPRPSDRV